MQSGTQTPVAGPHEWFADGRGSAQAPVTRVFDVSDLFALLARSRRLIAFTIAATTIAAAGVGVMTPKKYRATAEVFVDARGFKVLNSEVSQYNGTETVNADFETQIRIMTSGQVLRRVVEREKLATDPAFISQPGLLSRLKSLFGGPRETINDRIGYSVAMLEKMVVARRSERSYVVDLSVTDRDPVRAARITQAIAEVFIETQGANRRDLTKRLGSEVSARLQDLREKLDASEKRLAAYKASNDLIYSDGRLVTDRDLVALNEQLNQARVRTSKARARYAQIRRLNVSAAEKMDLQEVLDSPTIVQLRVKLAETTRQLAELRRNLGPRHPEIMAAEARSADARSAIAAEISRRRTALRNEVDQALAAERDLGAKIDELKTQSGATNSALIPLRELERAVEANKKVYEEFLVRARELSEQQGVVANSSQIITNASAPSVPIGLSLAIIIALGFFAGIPLGVGLAFLRYQLTQPRDTQPGAYAAQPGPEGSAGPQNTMRTRGATPSRASRPQQSIEHEQIANYLAAIAGGGMATPPDALVDLANIVEQRLNDAGHEIVVVTSIDGHAQSAQLALALAACWAWEGYEPLAIDGDEPAAGLSTISRTLGQPGLFDRYHRNVLEFVEWRRKGQCHLLGSLDPQARTRVNGARRFISQRLEDLSEEIELLVIDAGDLNANPYASTLTTAATAVITTANPGLAHQDTSSAFTPAPGQAHVHIEITGQLELTGQSERHDSRRPGSLRARRTPDAVA